MDQVVGSADSIKEDPRIGGAGCRGFGSVEATNESLVHPTMPGQGVERLSPGTNRPWDQTLRQLGEGSQASGPQTLPPGDNDQGANPKSLTLEGRPDIDVAMLLALRSAVVTKNSFPMLGHLAPDLNQIETANPPGAR